MARLLGTVASEEQADEAIRQLAEKFPEAKVEKKPGSSPGRFEIVLESNTLKEGVPNVESMERLVNSVR